jgi:hypothetical protein
MPRAPDDAAELLRQVRRLVGATDRPLFKSLVNRYIRIVAGPVKGPLKNPKKVGKVIKDCRRALHSIESVWGHEAFRVKLFLGPERRRVGWVELVWGHEALQVELTNFIRLCEQMMRGMPAARRSGGDPRLPIRKRLTVELAVELILNCGDRMPTVELVSEVAANLFELSMGEEPSNMDDYASDLLKQMEREDGFPGARARKRLDAAGKKAARDRLKEKLYPEGADLMPPSTSTPSSRSS